MNPTPNLNLGNPACNWTADEERLDSLSWGKNMLELAMICAKNNLYELAMWFKTDAKKWINK